MNRENLELSSLETENFKSPREFFPPPLDLSGSPCCELVLNSDNKTYQDNINVELPNTPTSTPIISTSIISTILNEQNIFSSDTETNTDYGSSHTDIDSKLILRTLDELKKENIYLKIENNDFYEKICNLEENNMNLKNKINKLTFENDLLEELNQNDGKIYYLMTLIVSSSFSFFLVKYLSK